MRCCAYLAGVTNLNLADVDFPPTDFSQSAVVATFNFAYLFFTSAFEIPLPLFHSALTALSIHSSETLLGSPHRTHLATLAPQLIYLIPTARSKYPHLSSTYLPLLRNANNLDLRPPPRPPSDSGAARDAHHQGVDSRR